ncbi:MAG: YfhO family protein [Chloroflexi bacterium]|nr:YfhO family protein [Chloroflexota bacterium]
MIRSLVAPAALALAVGLFYLPQLATGVAQWDGVDVHYASQRYFSDVLHTGRLPFWTPYIFSGFPFLADVQVGAWYPLNWPFFLAGIALDSLSRELFLHALIACFGGYALGLRWLCGNRRGALAVGMFYGLSGYFAAHTQHLAMFQVAAWLPWLLIALDAIARRVTARRLALVALLGAAVALPGHFQTGLYALSGVGIWAMLEAIAQRSLRRAIRYAAGVVAAGAWGGAIAAVMILPGLELVSESVRTRVNAFASDIGYFHVDSLRTLFQPDYYGLLSGAYWGLGDSTQHYFYAGVLLVPLAVLGMLNTRVLRTALFLSMPFLWYALGPGGGVFRIVARLPGFRSVELPMHGWFLPALGLALLGGAGVVELERRVRRRWVSVVLLCVTFVDVVAYNALLNPLVLPQVHQSVDWEYLAPLRALQAQLPADMTGRLYGAPTTAVGYRNHGLQMRVPTSYGYNPLELSAYADYEDAATTNPRLADGLAATYEVQVAQDGTIQVQPRASALPLAFFSRALRSIPDAAAANADLAELDPAQTTLIVGPAPPVQFDPSATAQVVDQNEDSLTIRYRATSSNMLRIALPAFPGWHAILDSRELPVQIVDYAFMGVVVPPGAGDIRLAYTPRNFVAGALISVVALVAAIACVVVRRPGQAAPRPSHDRVASTTSNGPAWPARRPPNIPPEVVRPSPRGERQRR